MSSKHDIYRVLLRVIYRAYYDAEDIEEYLVVYADDFFAVN